MAGAHAADGHLSRKGVFSIFDEDVNNIKIIAELIKKEFKFLPTIVKVRNENSYVIQFTKKEFSGFFREIFNFPLGPKTYNVKMPERIKNNSTFERSFVKGAMTFESSVNINKSISLYVTSKKFRDDIAQVLYKSRINIKTSEQSRERNRRKQYLLRTSENAGQKEMEKWMDYYIEGSEKWFKILELSNGFFGKVKTIKDAKKGFKLTYSKGRVVKVNSLIETIKNLKQTDIKYLYKKLKMGESTITKYLAILNESKIIYRSKNSDKLCLNNLSSSSHITLTDNFRKNLFNRINRYQAHEAQVCRLLKIKDFTYCRWRNGERGVPLDKLKVLLNLGRTPNKKHLKIKKVDREIIEFNKNVLKWRVPWRPWNKDIKLDINNKGVKKWIIKN